MTVLVFTNIFIKRNIKFWKLVVVRSLLLSQPLQNPPVVSSVTVTYWIAVPYVSGSDRFAVKVGNGKKESALSTICLYSAFIT